MILYFLERWFWWLPTWICTKSIKKNIDGSHGLDHLWGG